MTPEQLTALAAEIAIDPEQIGYAAHLPDAPGQVLDLLNAPRHLVDGTADGSAVARDFVVMFVGDDPAAMRVKRHLANLSAVGDDAAPEALQAREIAAMVLDVFEREMDVNFASPAVATLMDAAQTVGIFTAAQIARLRANGHRLVSRREALGLPHITGHDVIAALSEVANG